MATYKVTDATGYPNNATAAVHALVSTCSHILVISAPRQLLLLRLKLPWKHHLRHHDWKCQYIQLLLTTTPQKLVTHSCLKFIH